MGFFDKIFSGLSKTRGNLAELEELFQGYAPDNEDFYDELEELMVLADAGAATAEQVVYLMKKKTWEDRYRRGDEARAGLIRVLKKLLDVGSTELKLDTKPSVILGFNRAEEIFYDMEFAALGDPLGVDGVFLEDPRKAIGDGRREDEREKELVTT